MASRPFNIYPNGLSSILPKTTSSNGNLTAKLSKTLNQILINVIDDNINNKLL